MKTIAEIINLHGGLDWLKADSNYINLANPPYMKLVIEFIGYRKNEAVLSVAHYGEQNGDAMRDPEMVFWVDPTLKIWIPTYFRNDYAGVEQDAIVNEGERNQSVNTRLMKRFHTFAKEWDRNIREQGFVEIAIKQKHVRDAAAALAAPTRSS